MSNMTIAKQINNALKEELEGEPVVAKFATPKKYGRVTGIVQNQEVEYFNLEVKKTQWQNVNT